MFSEDPEYPILQPKDLQPEEHIMFYVVVVGKHLTFLLIVV